MKKRYMFFLIVVLFGFSSLVMAQQVVTVNGFVNTVNNGDVTKEFKERKKQSGIGFDISATNTTDGLRINYSFNKDGQKYSYDMSLNYNQSENILEAVDVYEDKELENGFIKEVYQLVPFWGVEATSNYATLKKFFKEGNTISTFSEIFDRCYFEEMGVCYTSTTGAIGTQRITVKVDMSDKAYNYAFDYLKKKKAEEEDKDFTFKLLCIGGVAAVILCIGLSATPKKKPKKYEAIPIITK